MTAGGQRYNFEITRRVKNGQLTGATPVNEADLAKEKLAAMTGKGGKGGKGGEVAKAVYANVGKR